MGLLLLLVEHSLKKLGGYQMRMDKAHNKRSRYGEREALEEQWAALSARAHTHTHTHTHTHMQHAPQEMLQSVHKAQCPPKHAAEREARWNQCLRRPHPRVAVHLKMQQTNPRARVVSQCAHPPWGAGANAIKAKLALGIVLRVTPGRNGSQCPPKIPQNIGQYANTTPQESLSSHDPKRRICPEATNPLGPCRSERQQQRQ
eukprot:1159305-Pelagomonas_calceolata.AAC.4